MMNSLRQIKIKYKNRTNIYTYNREIKYQTRKISYHKSNKTHVDLYNIIQNLKYKY